MAEEKGQVIGCSGIKKQENLLRASRMYVKKDRRGKGIGNALLQKILDFCGQREIYLTTCKEMNSEEFYLKHEFKTYKRENNIIFMKKQANYNRISSKIL